MNSLAHIARERPARAGRAPRGLTATLALSLGLLLLAACGGSAAPATPTPAGAPGPAPGLATATLPPAPSATAPAPTIPAAPPATAAPTEAPTGAAVVTATIAADQALTIYSLVAHDLVAQSMTVTGTVTPTMPGYIGISPRAGEGELLDTTSSTQTIPDDLIDNLADLGTTVTFADFMDAIGALDNGGKVQNNGIYLTLGVLEPQAGGDRVATYASYYRAANDATGYRYQLERVPGGPWVIDDRKEVWDH